jgi:hypothetical protein
MKILLTLLAVTLLPALSPVAHAAVLTQISYQIDGALFLPVFCNTPGPGPVACPNRSGPGLDITQLGADSNSPGSSTISDLTSAAVDVINVSSTPLALSIVMFTTDFTAPTGLGLTLVSHVGGTVLNGGGTFNYQSCVDPLNRTPDVTTLAGGNCPVGSSGSGPSTPNISLPGAFSDTETKPVTLLPGMYALNQSFEINLGPGTELNWSASSVLVSAVPEPSSSILVLGGTGLLGFGALWRKRLFRK